MKFITGDKISETFSFSQEDVNRFIELTGDNNPIHYDTAYAAGTVFKKPIIHGFLAASIFSKVLGITMPGYGTIYLKQEMNFKKPFYTDTEYTCTVEIMEIKGAKVSLNTRITDSEGELMIDGNAVVLAADN